MVFTIESNETLFGHTGIRRQKKTLYLFMRKLGEECPICLQNDYIFCSRECADRSLRSVYSCVQIKISTENHHGAGTLTGIPIGDPSLGYVTQSQKIWAVSSALGNMAFAYSFSMILIEIQVLVFNPSIHISNDNNYTY